MAEKAVATGRRIGVVATLSTTLNPTADLVRRVAAEQGKQIEIVEHLCEGAFAAVMEGAGTTPDRIVGAGLKQGLTGMDAHVLAAALMARAEAPLTAGAVAAPAPTQPTT